MFGATNGEQYGEYIQSSDVSVIRGHTIGKVRPVVGLAQIGLYILTVHVIV